MTGNGNPTTRIKCAGNWEITIFGNVADGKYGPNPYFNIKLQYKDGEGNYVDRKSFTMRDLYALQSALPRAIAWGEEQVAKVDRTHVGGNGQTEAVQETLGGDNVPF